MQTNISPFPLLLVLFWICMGITLLAATAMMIIGKSFSQKTDGNTPFTMMQLEFAPTKEFILTAYKNAGGRARFDLAMQLGLDYCFMLGAYYAPALLCFMTSYQHPVHVIAVTGIALACLQLVAHLCDCIENVYLYQYYVNPAFNAPFLLYKFLVRLKWALVTVGTLFALGLVIYNRIQYGHCLFY